MTAIDELIEAIATFIEGLDESKLVFDEDARSQQELVAALRRHLPPETAA